jgi:hypothetical protein
MASTKKLELEEDLPFQRAEWLVQRIGWFIWGLIVAAALVGLVGPGPLSTTQAPAPDGSLIVEYDRFLHHHNPTRLAVMPQLGDSGAEPFRVHVSRSLLDQIEVMRIEPEPQGREFDPDGVIYTFPRRPNTDQARILFHVQYKNYGRSKGFLRLAGHEPATLHQFVYP